MPLLCILATVFVGQNNYAKHKEIFTQDASSLDSSFLGTGLWVGQGNGKRQEQEAVAVF